MSKKPPFYYPGNKYIDEKWTKIQEAILAISEGVYEVELPDEIGVDHLDSILLGLKMMAETLNDREKMIQALGVAKAMDRAVIILNLEGKLKNCNAKAQELFQHELLQGQKVLRLFQDLNFSRILQDLKSGMSSHDAFTMLTPNGDTQMVSVTVVKDMETVEFSGVVIELESVSKKKPS